MISESLHLPVDSILKAVSIRRSTVDWQLQNEP